MLSYDYSRRKGVLEISWQEHPEMAVALKLQEQQNIHETGSRQAPSDETLVSPQAGA